MSAIIISGKELAQEKRRSMKLKTEELKQKGMVPGLAVILAGEDPASQSYVRAKERACKEIGIHSELDEVPATISENELLQKIAELNEADHIHGILVQLPLPDHISEEKVIEAIDPAKDVDGFHPINIGRMMIGQEAFLPCTPFGIVEMIKSKNIELQGKHVVIIGRSNIVGKPVGQLLLNEHATVTYCHSRTKNMSDYTQKADILVVAVGRPLMINADHMKEGAVVIDVGVNRNEEGKLVGDVDFESAKEKASYITPVPGGVGPMTITMLLHNTILSAERHLKEGN
ncbi:bifunctional methylenetetrahydrofolate dehydrogenase/methenyltetrahydrofolate cyclohydrolase FolD [Salipaludibacillus sp. LMS25]|jgi:methylenetetrahydrofolate dehydrogenase (NADP+)/methenyltetrahydrofolate cyclohydrolase|uniref:bifunctional methylenetetrahydrofolate dehydrogenase/methenyltetrahydrofolate cyclohydrolase FolD n=1 Tax=Salipaludibacillus sp. LMS25 TaxID=2924031 RepID=UPI0020D0A70F|nr:bifunctional methylenetetrahydrofolate dehydrogenase/methenyltetrahydrofolate cyclohydrolase FolD [Salipaludibacillus sp. LMS25]UTR14490.1 bifunctional methylenetetrahydrofolate dehydrogenase/methenyltetrahydrofolate cyclohydrolase FolD [Salipaludibacillus sp. LMS25]